MVLTSLTERVSSARLKEPAPTEEQLELIFKAALRAPDHGNLRPWRFIRIQGDARQKLGNVFVDVTLRDQPDLPDTSIERIRQLPFRAPMIVALVLHGKPHKKVPEVEQILSLGAAGHGLITAAYHLGVGAYWRTGSLCYDPAVANALGLADNEKLLGFIYLGTPDGVQKATPQLDLDEFVTSWAG